MSDSNDEDRRPWDIDDEEFARSPAYLNYPATRQAETIGMTNTEVGIYVRLMWAAWPRDGLPDDSRALRIIVPSTPIAKIRSILRQKFCKSFAESGATFWTCSQLVEQKTKRRALLSKRRNSGRMGGLASKPPKKKPEKTEASAQASAYAEAKQVKLSQVKGALKAPSNLILLNPPEPSHGDARDGRDSAAFMGPRRPPASPAEPALPAWRPKDAEAAPGGSASSGDSGKFAHGHGDSGAHARADDSANQARPRSSAGPKPESLLKHEFDVPELWLTWLKIRRRLGGWGIPANAKLAWEVAALGQSGFYPGGWLREDAEQCGQDGPNDLFRRAAIRHAIAAGRRLERDLPHVPTYREQEAPTDT